MAFFTWKCPIFIQKGAMAIPVPVKYIPAHRGKMLTVCSKVVNQNLMFRCFCFKSDISVNIFCLP